MRYILYIAFFLLGVGGAQAQPPQKVNSNYQFKAVGGDSAVRLPVRKSLNPNYTGTGALWYDSVSEHLRWFYDQDHDTSFPYTKLDSVYRSLVNNYGGDTDIVLYGGTCRPAADGSGNISWAWDSYLTTGHYTLNFDEQITPTVAGFTIYYPHVSNIISLIAVPDETFIQGGWQFGSSVDADSAEIYIYRLYSQWVSVTFDRFNPPNYIDQPGRGISLTYDSTTGIFAATANDFKIGLFNNILNITSGNPKWMPVVDGSYNGVNPTHFYMYDYAADTVVHGVYAHDNVFCCNISAPANYWGPENGLNANEGTMPVQSGQANVWIFAIMKKN